MRLCLIFFGFVYVFFLRFLAPPESSGERKRVDSSEMPHAPSNSEFSRDRPPKIRRCSSAGKPCDAATCCFMLSTLLSAVPDTACVRPARSRTNSCMAAFWVATTKTYDDTEQQMKVDTE